MDKQGKNIIRTAGVIVFLIIVCLFIENNALFYHLHVLENGTVISHAHPNNDTQSNLINSLSDKEYSLCSSEASLPNNKHRHTEAELLILASIQLLVLLFILVLSGLFIKTLRRDINLNISIPVKKVYFLFNSRAPPTTIFSI